MPKKKKAPKPTKTKRHRLAEALSIRRDLAARGFLTDFPAVKQLAEALSRFVDTGVSETLAVTVPEAGGIRLRLICTSRLGRKSGVEVVG